VRPDAVADLLVVHRIHAQCIKQALLQKIAVRAEDIVVVGPTDRIIDGVGGIALGSALIFVVKAGHQGQMRRHAVVSLIEKLVAQVDDVQRLG